MGYLEDLQIQINNRDFSKFWQLWEEYCTSDVVDLEEFSSILKAIKDSEFNKQFGQLVETALPLWETITDSDGRYEILRLLIDLQTTNSIKLASLALDELKNRYSTHPQFNDRLRLIGLRTGENFQGALSYYDLLAHMEKGNHVFHTGGWGTGEIIELSLVREQVAVEFENIAGRKYFTFSNAFKNLVPLNEKGFLARRFADPDAFEKEAKEDPVTLIKLLLRDLGPLSASEIKEELCELVIPEQDWVKWWQGARAKLKKDTMIECPKLLKDSFRLRKSELTHEEKFQKDVIQHTGIDELIQTSYSFVRDNPIMLKKGEIKNSVQEKLVEALQDPQISQAQQIQIYIFLETSFGHTIPGTTVEKFILETEQFLEIINAIEIVAFKKRLANFIREYRKDWAAIFLNLLFTPQQSTLREYLFKELNQPETVDLLQAKLAQLIAYPLMAPEFLVWYFQKLMSKDSQEFLYHDKTGICLFFESLLILFSLLDSKPEFKELSKKIYIILTSKRFTVVRAVIQDTSLQFIQEFLLLIAKCQLFTDHDLKILRSLAEVIHPDLNPDKQRKEKAQFDQTTLWATEESYQRAKERIQSISTTEMVGNAREIEAARSLGDLRENSEYKFALERRSRLQSEMHHLASQLNQSRILTKEDILLDEVSVGCVVDLINSQNISLTYTILGPWDADIEKGIISSQSQLGQALLGLKKQDKLLFKNEEYTIVGLRSFLTN